MQYYVGSFPYFRRNWAGKSFMFKVFPFRAMYYFCCFTKNFQLFSQGRDRIKTKIKSEFNNFLDWLKMMRRGSFATVRKATLLYRWNICSAFSTLPLLAWVGTISSDEKGGGTNRNNMTTVRIHHLNHLHSKKAAAQVGLEHFIRGNPLPIYEKMYIWSRPKTINHDDIFAIG